MSFIAQAAWLLTGDDLKLLVAVKERRTRKGRGQGQEDKEEEKDKETKQNELLRGAAVKVLTEQASSGRNPDYTHEDFAYKLKVEILMIRSTVGNSTLERISTFPNVYFRAAKSHETVEEVVKPDWKNLLFGYILTRMSLQWQSGGLAVLACRALLENSVMWFSSLSAKPVAFMVHHT